LGVENKTNEAKSKKQGNEDEWGGNSNKKQEAWSGNPWGTAKKIHSLGKAAQTGEGLALPPS